MMIDQQQAGYTYPADMDLKCTADPPLPPPPTPTAANLTAATAVGSSGDGAGCGGADSNTVVRLSCSAAATTTPPQQQQQQLPLSSTTPNIPHHHHHHHNHHHPQHQQQQQHQQQHHPHQQHANNHPHQHQHHLQHHHPQYNQQHTPLSIVPQHANSIGSGGGGGPVATSAHAATPPNRLTPASAAAAAAAVVLAALCGSCCGPISTRYMARVVDAFYHEECLQCTSCGARLMHSCFARNGRLYCRIDYERLFLKNRCLGCGDRIGSDELVMRTADNVFHLKCFACVVCGIQLQKGEQYVVKQSQLFCRSDYEKEVEMLQGFNDFVDDYFAEDTVFPSKVDGRRGPKRPRTILNTQQRRQFKASFDLSPKPCRKVRETLAKETGLSLRIVQVWFQNQRAKVKKIQKKARQDPLHAKGCSSETESLGGESSLEHDTKIKDENDSDTESSYLHLPLDCDHQKGPHIKVERDAEDDCFKKAIAMCGSMHHGYKDTADHISGDGRSGGVGNGGVGGGGSSMHLNTIMGLTYSAFQQLMSSTTTASTAAAATTTASATSSPPPSSLPLTASHGQQQHTACGMGAIAAPPGSSHHILNPIDRLYSMQSAYFRCDEGKFHHSHSHVDDDMEN